MLRILVIVSKNVIDKSCDADEYLDYENCKCKKRLINKLVDECTETIEEVKLTNIIFTENENENSCKCISCTVYIVLLLQCYLQLTLVELLLIMFTLSGI